MVLNALILVFKLRNIAGHNYSPFLVYASAENPNGILEEVEFMVIDICLYAGLLFIIEQRVVIKFLNYWIYSGILSKSADDVSSVPKAVLEERKKIDILTRLIKGIVYIKRINIIKQKFIIIYNF